MDFRKFFSVRRLDFIKLAQYSAAGMPEGIAVPSRTREARCSLIRRRHDLVGSSRTVKQRIRSHLLYLGVKEPAGLEHWNEKGVKAPLKLPLHDSAKDTMKSLMREPAFLKRERPRADKQIRSLCSKGGRCGAKGDSRGGWRFGDHSVVIDHLTEAISGTDRCSIILNENNG